MMIMNEKTKPLIKFCIDLSSGFLSIFLSYTFLYNFDFFLNNFSDITKQFTLFSFSYLISSLITKNYASVWAYASLSEIFLLASNIILSFIFTLFIGLISGIGTNVKAVLLFFILFSFLSASLRLLRRFLSDRNNILIGNKKAIIIGANQSTNNFLKNPINSSKYNILGIIDDTYKVGKRIVNHRVIGKTTDLEMFIKEKDVEIIIYTGVYDRDPILKKNLVRRIVNLSATFLTLEESLKKDIPLTISSMDEVSEIENTLLPKVSKRKSKNILVTGGAGYIGVHLVKILLDDGYNVTILDNFTFGKDSILDIKNHPNLTIIEGDITSIKDLVKSVKNNRFVIALAAIVGDPASSIDAEETLNLNYESTKILTQICNFYEVEKLIFASSCSVYGSNDSIVLNEESYLNPVSLYARTRIYSENYILDNCESVSPTIMRLSTVFGFSPRMRYDLVVNTLLIRALRDKKFSVFGGDQWRPFVHCYDVARAFKMVIESDKSVTHNQIFNVGSDDMNFTIDQIGEKVAKKFPDAEFNKAEEDVDKRNYRVSFSKISGILGFKKNFDVEMGLNEMVEKIGTDSKLLEYENKIYSNFTHLKDSYDKQ